MLRICGVATREAAAPAPSIHFETRISRDIGEREARAEPQTTIA